MKKKWDVIGEVNLLSASGFCSVYKASMRIADRHYKQRKKQD